MMEITTRSFSITEANQVALAIEAADYSKPVSSGIDEFTLAGSSFPRLDAYTIEGDIDIGARFENFDGLLPEINRSMNGVESAFENQCQFFVDYGESDSFFDPETASDITICFGRARTGPSLWISTGEISPASTDRSERARIFNRLCSAAGLPEISTVVENNVTVLRTELSVRRTPWEPLPSTFPWVSLSSCDLSGCDFTMIRVHFDCISEVMKCGNRLLSSLPIEKIVSCHLDQYCTIDDLPMVEKIMAPLKRNCTWRAVFSGQPKYGSVDLAKISSDCPEFWLQVYTLSLKGIGKFSVDIQGVDGRMAFIFYGKPNKRATIERFQKKLEPVFYGIRSPWDDRIV